MTDGSSPWSDAFTRSPGDCGLCGSATRSHALKLAFDVDEDAFSPTADPDHDWVRLVCHGCYEDVDGDAETIAAAITEVIREYASQLDRPVVEFDQVLDWDERVPETVDEE